MRTRTSAYRQGPPPRVTGYAGLPARNEPSHELRNADEDVRVPPRAHRRALPGTRASRPAMKPFTRARNADVDSRPATVRVEVHRAPVGGSRAVGGDPRREHAEQAQAAGVDHPRLEGRGVSAARGKPCVPDVVGGRDPASSASDGWPVDGACDGGRVSASRSAVSNGSGSGKVRHCGGVASRACEPPASDLVHGWSNLRTTTT